ncbi:MAG: hypothetical protein JWM16_222 [Verrucomicrobiales bacterium]|nr:hypothetical protein [Verrucomicrobiales bacterium]
MSPGLSDFPQWSNRKWLLTVFLVFLLQVALILYLGERPSLPIPPPRFQTSIQLAADPLSEEQMASSPILSDPTLFALPQPKSFSGDAWFTFSPMEHSFANWDEPRRWLELDTNRLGMDFSSLVERREDQPWLIADKPMPPLAGIEILTAPQLVRTHSELRLEGDLARRPLVRPIELPSWANGDILTNSVAQLIVDSYGFTVSAILLSGSGFPEADQFALRFASSAQFAPLPFKAGEHPRADSLSFGRLAFEWHTIPPKMTNTARAAP